MPHNPSAPTPSNAPNFSERMKPKKQFNTEKIGFTLKIDEQTLREIDELHEETIKAAQDNKKFSWR